MTQPKPLPCKLCGQEPKTWTSVTRLFGRVQCKTTGCWLSKSSISTTAWAKLMSTTQAHDDEVRAGNTVIDAHLRTLKAIEQEAWKHEAAPSHECCIAETISATDMAKLYYGLEAALRAGQREEGK